MIGMLRVIVLWLLGLSNPGEIVRIGSWSWYSAVPAAAWVLIALAVLALGAAAINFLPRNGLPWKAGLVVSLIRVGCFGLLALLICQVELRLNVFRSLKPNVALISDTSGSMGIRDDGERSRFEAAEEFADALVKEHGKHTNFPRYDLNWQLRMRNGRPEPAGASHLMEGLGGLIRQERDLQAVIMLTDGNDTTGNSGAAVAPILAARGVPVYPVVFGNPEAPQIASVRLTGAGEYVRLGDELYLQAEISTSNLEGQEVRARLLLENAQTPLATHERIKLDRPAVPIGFTIKPDRPGRFTYRIKVDGIRGAATAKLLEVEHTVDVIDQRIRVLYIDVPRPERGMVGRWLARDPIVDFAALTYLPKEGWYAQGAMRHQNTGTGLPDQESDLYEYDVIILGDIPRAYFRAGDAAETKMQWLVDFVKRRGGGLITQGGESAYAAGQYQNSALAEILPFTVERTRTPQIPKLFRVIPTSLGFSHPLMMLERDIEASRNAWFQLPRIEGCTMVGAVKPGAMLLALREVEDHGSVPVIAFQEVGKGRVLSLSIDTTWRWQMLRPRGDEAAGGPETTDYFRRFWGNAVRYLAPDPRLNPERPQIERHVSETAVGQTVRMSTRLVDRNYRPISKADLSVLVTDPSDKTLRIYPSDSAGRPGVYEYDVLLNKPGVWRVQAIHQEENVRARIAKAEEALAKAQAQPQNSDAAAARRELQLAKAEISATDIRAGESRSELEDPRSRPCAMADFAASVGGAAFRPDQLAELSNTLHLVSFEVSSDHTAALWNLPATMALFIGLVSLDCLIRKRSGQV